MNDFLQRYGEWALVAGAAEGIGAAFSEALAQRGVNLIMADKNEEAMSRLSSKLIQTFGIRTILLSADLSDQSSWKKCTDAASSVECRLLVYTPAYSPIKPFCEVSVSELDLFLDLNCRAPLHLVHSFVGTVPAGRRGGIILLSSLAGLVGPPLSAVYAGTKAFNILLAESLHSEFLDQGIDVGVCCAGITSTPTYRSSKPVGKTGNIMQPSKVADYALKNLGRKTICIPGRKNRLSFFLLVRLLPRKISANIVSRAMYKMYPPTVP